LRRIDRSNQNNILKFKNEDLDGIFYIYNSYHDPDEIVLNMTNYYDIRYSSEIQNILKIFLEYNIILFINYRSELEDPNFDILLKWANERQKNISNRYYLLIRNRDILDYKSLVRFKYSDDYQNLILYFNKLLDRLSQLINVSGYASVGELCELFMCFT
jgi:hypothetical protein